MTKQIRNGVEVEFDSIAAKSENLLFYGKKLINGTNTIEGDWMDDPIFPIYQRLGILTLTEVAVPVEVKKPSKKIVKDEVTE